MVLPLILGAVGALSSVNAAKKATNAQVASAQSDRELNERIYNETTKRFQPYYDQGVTAQNALLGNLGLGEMPEGVARYGADTDPNYRFALDQGMETLQGSAAARGGLFSGNTGKAITQFGQNTAMGFRDNYLNRLTGLSAAGQAAAGNQATAGANYANAQSAANANTANALSAGAIAQGNAVNNFAGNAVGYLNYNSAMNGGNSGFNIGGTNSLFGGNSWG